MCKRVFILISLLLSLVVDVSAQATYTYITTFDNVDVSNVSIKHRAPKWTALHQQQYGGAAPDTYDENDMFPVEKYASGSEPPQLQATNTYVDTIYMYKGTSTTLVLLNSTYDINKSNALYYYQRWFDYRSDGNYHISDTGETLGGVSGVTDLLTPNSAVQNNKYTAYRFANGYVQNGSTDQELGSLWQMDFYYPLDSEAEDLTSADGTSWDNKYYIVACDASLYSDYGSGEARATTEKLSSTSDYYEPTLTARSVFYIIGIDGTETSADSAPNADFSHYWHLLDAEYQGGSDKGKYVDEYDLVYPSRRLSNFTEEMVALSKDAQAYAIPGKSSSDDDGFVTATIYSYNDDNTFELLRTSATRTAVTLENHGDTIHLSGNNRKISFRLKQDTEISGDSKGHCGAPWKVNDNDSIVICVTKTIGSTTYNLARYKITFRDYATPLTQTQLDKVSPTNAASIDESWWWKDMTYRTPQYMQDNYDLLTQLTFDYGDVTAATVFGADSGSQCYYPFPKGWSTCSFGFYDGEKGNGVKGINDANDNSTVTDAYTRFGMYCITNSYVAYAENRGQNQTLPDKDGLVKDAGGYWMYIDASDQPAELVELNFEENLCVGSEVIGTAWIKNGGQNAATGDDSAIMFSIVGVSYDDDGKETHTTLYSQCSGQIRTTTYLNTSSGYYAPDEDNLESTVTGKGSDTNEWFQLYFSFINTSEANYDHYTIRVENFCASTNGGDYYFDEVKLYVLHPTVAVAQIDPICTDSSEQALTCIDIDYEAIMSRIGYVWEEYLGTSTFVYDETNPTDPDDSELALLDFVVINEYAYENFLAEHADDYTDEIELKAAAITASLVTFGNETLGDEEGVTNRFNFPTCRFFLDYNANRQYNMDDRGSNLPVYNRYKADDVRYFYVREENDVKYICSDMYSDMQAYTPYLFIVMPYTISDDSYSDDDEEEYKAREFAQYIDDACTITARFSLTSTTVIKVDGMVADPLVDYCAGQVVEISPEVTYNDDNGNLAKLDNAYFDFFFGTTDEYTAENDEYNGGSVREALLAFRSAYHDAEEIDSWSTPTTTTFTQDHFDILSHYLSVQRTGGKNNQLVLHEHNLSVRVLTSGIALVIQPIEATTYNDDGEIMICCGYVPLELEAHGDAPSLNTGFSNINYPDNDYVPAVRLGKHHIDTSSATMPININIRDAQYITEYDDSGEVIEIDHLGRVTSTDDLDKLFLIDTDDPDYLSIIDNIDPDTQEYTFTDYDLPVGRIIRLWADNDGTGDTRQSTPEDLQGTSYMQVYFYNSDTDTYTDDNGDSQTEDVVKFTPKEGCYYVMKVHFEEKHGADAVGTACQGELPITFKVVPEYVVWNGTENDNWNNDSHWTRADYSDLAGTDTSGSDSGSTTDSPYADYTTNDANTTSNGFVPMLFTNVVIPQGKNVELYPAYFAASTTSTTEENIKEWTGDEASESVYSDETMDLAEHPTENIMYDMMVYGGELDLRSPQLSSRKKVGLYDNTSYDITSMQTQPYRTNVCNDIHLAQNAHVLHSELLLANTVWTDVAIPQNQWTLVASPLTGIVAGDWYTDTSTGTQATLPLFTDITFSSDVNDRYSPAVYQRSWQTAGTIIAQTGGTDRSVPAYETTGWTSAYNDAYVSYQPGEGYSIKGGYGGTESNDSLVFRFPKSDTDYTYGSSSSNTATHDQGQLAIFSMVDRDDPDDDYSSSATGKITVDLSQESATDYYIVGNPFTAYMSMKEFMAENTQFDAYWLPEDGFTGGPVAGNSSDNSSWQMTSEGSGDVYVKPYSAFFVRVDDNYTGTGDKYTVTFTPEMQTMTLPADVTLLQFAIRASSAKGTSSASIAYSDNAANDYVLGEDVLLLTDNSWNHSQPMVYSVAGSNAVAVNMVADLYQIPLGVFATDDSDYTLTFVGVDKLDTPSLYDADELTDTPLTEGYTLTLNGSTHGRYFLRSAGAPEGISDIAADDDNVNIYSPTPHTLVITATSEITSIEVYALNGTALAKANPASLSCTLSALPPGVALVRTTTANTTTTKKLYVR